MLIIGIDPGISGSICFFQDGRILNVIEMPTMTEGKKNKRQVNGSQIYNEISKMIDKIEKQKIKVVIEQEGNTITKKEILECSDGRKAYDGPNYWELFAQFYYVDVNTPEYCRYYSRSGHAFKTPGKVCLDKNGEWEVR